MKKDNSQLYTSLSRVVTIVTEFFLLMFYLVYQVREDCYLLNVIRVTNILDTIVRERNHNYCVITEIEKTPTRH